MGDLPGHRIEIVPLAHGARVDVWCEHTGEHHCKREHFGDLFWARKFAEMMHRATGSPIIDSSR